MKHESKFIRVITDGEGEEIMAIDSIDNISRTGVGAIITQKDGTKHMAKVFNVISDTLEPLIISTDSPDEAQSRRDELEEHFGISVESQPQFLNFIREKDNLVINASAIKKIEPKGESATAVTLKGDKEPILINCHIRDIVQVLANVIPIDAGGL